MRRKCQLSNAEKRETNLLQYKDEIIETINRVVPGKHPEVFRDSFQTDPLDRGEAIRVGRALSKIPGLSTCGKEVTIYRMFDGEMVDDVLVSAADEAQQEERTMGGHM